ncbi:MAG: hypothetical protein ACREH5_09200 [Candidatus Omnitrophota bacterium]
MSLRAVHVIVILFSIAITLFFGFWAMADYRTSVNSANLYWGIASLAGGTALIPYLVWFILKTRKKAE